MLASRGGKSLSGRIQLRHIILLAVLSLALGVGLLHHQSEGGLRGLSKNIIGDDYWKIWSSSTVGPSGPKAPFLEIPKTDEGCEAFDPALPAEQDPPNCLRARQYRQVQRVLSREKLAEHDRWWFTQKDNLAVLNHLLTCYATFPSPCPPRPLIISGWWYTAMGIGSGVSGEAIWQKGVLEYVEELGLSIISVGPYNNWITVAEMMPDVYRTLWGSHVDTVTCLGDPRCIKDYVPPLDAEDLSMGVPEEERGVIPLWAMSIVDYWGSRPLEIAPANNWYWGISEPGEWSFHPLGPKWILTPFPYPGHIYLPYSIEQHCLPTPYTPPSQRNHSVLLLAKRSFYFHADHAPDTSFYQDLSKDVQVDLLTNAHLENDQTIPDGLITIPQRSREEYAELLGSVKALLGIGLPVISPSVYTALCQGTPIVMPNFVEDPDLSGWQLYNGGLTQHGPAQMIGPPYVYSYYKGNYTQMREVTQKAIDTPIERFILPEMKHDYGLEQMRLYLDRDTKGMFDHIVRENNGTIPRLKANVREQCYVSKRCPEVFPPGRVPAFPPAVLSVQPIEPIEDE